MNKQNQKAIECLKEVKELCINKQILGFLTSLRDNDFDENYVGAYIDSRVIENYIDNKIKELEENDEDKH